MLPTILLADLRNELVLILIQEGCAFNITVFIISLNNLHSCKSFDNLHAVIPYRDFIWLIEIFWSNLATTPIYVTWY